MLKKRWLFLPVLLLAVVLTACSSAGKEEEPEGVTLIYANLTEGRVDQQAVDKFNRAHREAGVQIEVRDYYDEDGWSGKDRLLTEIAAGKIPDIIDLGGSSDGLPYSQLARKGYLEDLWPYIENDPKLGREGVWEAPLKAAEVDGGLYTVFHGVRVRTLVGAESLVGYRNSWTLSELLEAFSAMPDGSTVLNYYYTKSDIFSCIFRMSIDSYVDWETGAVSFDSEPFRAALEFVNRFPAEFHGFDFEGGAEKVEEEWMDRALHGEQMLYEQYVFGGRYVQAQDAFFGQGGRAAFIGYPTEDGSMGSSFEIRGRKLAMSSTCQDKDAAWEFLRQIILPQFKTKDQADTTQGLPINLSDFNLLKQRDFRPPSHISEIQYCLLGTNGPAYRSRRPTADEFERFETFVNSVEKIDLYDTALYDIVWDACGPYFAGDKTLDETVDLVQQRVSLYVNEQQ